MRQLSHWANQYDRASRGVAFISDWVMGVALFAIAVIAIGAAAFGVAHAVESFSSNVNEQSMVAKLADDLPSQGADAQAIITPPTDESGATNCNGSGQCREIALYFRTTGGDQYVAYDFVPATSGSVGALKVYTFTGFTSGGAHQNATLRETLPMQAFSVHPVLASQMASDAADPYANLIANIESQAGMTPQDVTLNYGPPLAVAHNAVYYVSGTSSTGYSFSFDMSQRSIAPKDQMVSVGSYAPTPAPAPSVGSGTLVFHWPGATTAQDPTTPTQFTVSEAFYHDAFFAEVGTCGGIAAPNPQYTSGSSATYYPATMWGQSGPWVYPNPNPTSPPGQNSGPGTFGVSSSAAGVCNLGVYDVYTNRSNATPSVTVPVQVMGALQLNNGASWSSSASLVFTAPSAAAQTVTAGKTYDSEQLSPAFPGSPCAGVATASTTGYSTQPSPSSAYTTAGISVAPSGGSGGTCTMQVTDQYGEPATTINVSVASGLFVGDASANPVASVDLVSNGSGGWTPQSLYLWKKYLAQPFTGTVAYGNCGGYAHIGPSAPNMGSSSTNGSSQDLPFTIYGDASTMPLGGSYTCTMTLSDNFSESTTVAVKVDPQPTATPAPSPTPASLPCTLDSYGYCSVKTGSTTETVSCDYYWPTGGISSTKKTTQPASVTYATYNASGLVDTATDNYTYAQIPWDPSSGGGGGCSMNDAWSPEEPSVQFGDPNLP